MIWLQTPTVFWLGGGTISLSYRIYIYRGLMMLRRQKYIYTKEQVVPELSTSEIELAIEKLKSHKSPGIALIPAVLIKVGGRTIV